MNHTGKFSRYWVAAILLGVSGAASANEAWWTLNIIYSDPAGVINSSDDTATVELWAGFKPKFYAFEGGWLDITADDPMDRGEWSEPVAILEGPGWQDGVIDGERVGDIRVGQLHALGGYFADTSNPIRAWQATWTTFDLTKRNVDLSTLTNRFGIYVDGTGQWKDLTGDVREGTASIHVVPCPGSNLGGLAVVILAGRRRRTDRHAPERLSCLESLRRV